MKRREEWVRWRPKLPEGTALFSARAHPKPVRFAVAKGERGNPDEQVEWGLRVASAWSIRFLTVAAAVVVLGYIISKLTVIIIPLLIACLLAVLLEPVARWLRTKARMTRTVAAAISTVGLVVLVLGLITVAGAQMASEIGQLVARAEAGFNRMVEWLESGPYGISTEQLHTVLADLQNQVTGWVKAHSSTLASGALSGISSVGEVAAGALIALFLLFFFLREGRQIWFWVVRLLPDTARFPLHEAGVRGWVTIGSYARTQILVAFVDAVGIALGALVLGLPMWLPIGILVFIGSFIPMIGAILTGAIAVLVALVDQGPTTAIIMFIIVIAVQQIEGNVLQPWLMGNAVSLHPVAVLLSVAGGTYLAGIIGALFVVPLVAFINTTMLYLNGYDKFPQLRDDPNRPGGGVAELTAYLDGPADEDGEQPAGGKTNVGHPAESGNKEAPAASATPS